jgi:hypothetical protein
LRSDFHSRTRDSAIDQMHRVAWQIVDHARALKLREEAKEHRR